MESKGQHTSPWVSCFGKPPLPRCPCQCGELPFPRALSPPGDNNKGDVDGSLSGDSGSLLPLCAPFFCWVMLLTTHKDCGQTLRDRAVPRVLPGCPGLEESCHTSEGLKPVISTLGLRMGTCSGTSVGRLAPQALIRLPVRAGRGLGITALISKWHNAHGSLKILLCQRWG